MAGCRECGRRCGGCRDDQVACRFGDWVGRVGGGWGGGCVVPGRCSGRSGRVPDVPDVPDKLLFRTFFPVVPGHCSEHSVCSGRYAGVPDLNRAR